MSKKSRSRAGGQGGARTLRIERLEDRQMMSATPWQEQALAENSMAYAQHAQPQYRTIPPAPPRAAGAAAPAAAGPLLFPSEQTFELHSLPNATRVIYLDFTGHFVKRTRWNADFQDINGADNVLGFNPATNADDDPSITIPAFSFEGGADFSNNELAAIQRIWKQVSEDFLPFQVDVTTASNLDVPLPPNASFAPREASRRLINESNSGDGDGSNPPDLLWGVLVSIGGDSFAAGAGGIAYLDSFDEGSALFGIPGADDFNETPAFVFANALNNDAGDIAEAVSHEVGHTLGLDHDGRVFPTEEYFAGHGPANPADFTWAPIMGVGYGKKVVQWSQGEYNRASNTQDDLAIITSPFRNNFGLRADQIGDTFNSPTVRPLATTFGVLVDEHRIGNIIGTTDDLDVFSFQVQVRGLTKLNIDPATFIPVGVGVEFATPPVSPNLDIRARILDATGAQVVVSDLTNNLSASFSIVLDPGTYYLEVDGTGNLNPLTNGYSEYGSLGGYAITGLLPISPDLFELNNSFQAARNLGVLGNQTINNLTINTVNDHDYFRFTAAGSGIANIRLTSAFTPSDLSLYLFDANFKEVGRATTLGNAESLFARVIGGAVYYIKVAGRPPIGGNPGDVNANYSLIIDAPDGVVVDKVGVFGGGRWQLDVNNNKSQGAGDADFTRTGGVPVVGRWVGSTGGEADEIGVFSAGVWKLDRNNDGDFDDAIDATFTYGNASYIPVVGDWNGDGFDQLGLFKEGRWTLDENSNGILDAGDRTYVFGIAGDTPVTGRWRDPSATDPARNDRIGTFRAGVWKLDASDNRSYGAGDLTYGETTPFGAGQIPITGDWDGDFTDEIGAFSPATRTFTRDVSGNGLFGAGDDSFVYTGSVGTIPVAGVWRLGFAPAVAAPSPPAKSSAAQSASAPSSASNKAAFAQAIEAVFASADDVDTLLSGAFGKKKKK